MTTLLRRELGDVLRERRRAQGRTLREVSATASVSLGYLSEVERGEKEASSRLLASICGALELPLSQVLIDVSSRMAEERRSRPDRDPAGPQQRRGVGLRGLILSRSEGARSFSDLDARLDAVALARPVRVRLRLAR